MSYEELTQRLTSEYELFLFALNGRYQQLRAPGTEVTPRAVASLKSDAFGFAKTFYSLAVREVDNYSRSLLEDASEELVTSVSDRKEKTLNSIRLMVIENLNQATKLAMTGVGAFANLIKNAGDAMGALIQKRVSVIEFKSTDTSGRKWHSRKLLSALVRDFAYQSFVDWQIEGFKASGVDLIETDGGHVFSLSGNDIYPSLAEVRNKYFHPNSKTTVMAHVSP